ncbi:MAG: hypothetical protein AAF799_39915 [Myxococcota bacterium]
MTRGSTTSKPSRGPRGPRRHADRSRPAPSGAAFTPPDDDDTAFLFAAHPDQTIDTSYIIERAFHLIGERPLQVIGIAVASALLGWGMLLGITGLGALDNSLSQSVGIDAVTHPVSVIALMLLAWSAALLLQAPLIGAAIEVHTDERRGFFSLLLNRAVGKLPQLMAGSLFVILATMLVMTITMGLVTGLVVLAGMLPWDFIALLIQIVGVLVFMFLGMRALVGSSMLVPVMLVEELALGDALRRSWTMGWRNGTAILWALLLPNLLLQAVLFPTQFMPWYIGMGIALVGGIGLSLYYTAVVPVTYVAVREYIDGLHPGRLLVARR